MPEVQAAAPAAVATNGMWLLWKKSKDKNEKEKDKIKERREEEKEQTKRTRKERQNRQGGRVRPFEQHDCVEACWDLHVHV